MDLNQFTVETDSCNDTELVCDRCPGWSVIASSVGVLGRVKQLPNPITLTALLKAATEHDAEAHRG